MTQQISNRRLVAKLQKIIDTDNNDSIKAAVAQEALDHDLPINFFEDLLRCGCVSGMMR